MPDPFADAGSWSHALTVPGARDIGLEWDGFACKTRARVGRSTIQTDVARHPVWISSGRILELIASPPCQAWSMAGKRLGLVVQPLVHQAASDLASGREEARRCTAPSRPCSAPRVGGQLIDERRRRPRPVPRRGPRDQG